MYQQCIDAQQPPSMQAGDAISSGVYFRNLKKKHSAKRYQDDADVDPIYGWKLSRTFWRDAEQQQGDLSVNQADCVRSPECSIAIQVSGDHYYHVAVINLGAMNRSNRLSCRFCAVYTPVDTPKNACHFEIVPEEGTVSRLQELMALLDDPFPPGKLPHSAADRATALQAWNDYRSICDTRRWVRNSDGSLAV